MTEYQSTFISLLYANCEVFADAYGIKCVPAIVAQAIHESNWGRSTLASKYHNYFGMKCGKGWRGRAVNLKTKEEYKVGELTTIRDDFRAYTDMRSGVRGYFDFINTERYSNLKGVTDPLTYLKRIKADGYATSSTYTEKCMYYVTNYINPWLAQNDASRKSIKEIALEVIQGKWGNGRARREALEAEGYNYLSVQTEVSRIMHNDRSDHGNTDTTRP